MTVSVQTNVAIKEEEIRPDDIFGRFMELSAQDAETFFDKTQFEVIDCPACKSAQFTPAFKKHTFQYVQCDNCQTLYTNPRPNGAELLRYYSQSESQNFWSETILKETGNKRKAAIMEPNIKRIEDILSQTGQSPKRVLDVGAATGTFLTEWKKRHEDAEILAIEPGEVSAQKCREAGIQVFEGFVENEADKPEVEGDLVTCFEVLEHVQCMEEFAQSLYKVTAPGGLALATCLGGDGFDIQLLWDKSRSVMPPYHMNFLSCKGMEILFKQSGFDQVDILTPGRLDVEIVKKSIDRGAEPNLSRFEELLLSKGEETLQAFQKFLAEHGLSSHVWVLCHRK